MLFLFFLTKRCNDVVITVRHSLLRVLKARRRVAAGWLFG